MGTFSALSAAQLRELHLSCAADALEKATTSGTIRRAFERAGLVPYNPDRVLAMPCVTLVQKQAHAHAEAKRARSMIPIEERGYYAGVDGLSAAKTAGRETKQKRQKTLEQVAAPVGTVIPQPTLVPTASTTSMPPTEVQAPSAFHISHSFPKLMVSTSELLALADPNKLCLSLSLRSLQSLNTHRCSQWSCQHKQ